MPNDPDEPLLFLYDPANPQVTAGTEPEIKALGYAVSVGIAAGMKALARISEDVAVKPQLELFSGPRVQWRHVDRRLRNLRIHIPPFDDQLTVLEEFARAEHLSLVAHGLYELPTAARMKLVDHYFKGQRSFDHSSLHDSLRDLTLLIEKRMELIEIEAKWRPELNPDIALTYPLPLMTAVSAIHHPYKILPSSLEGLKASDVSAKFGETDHDEELAAVYMEGATRALQQSSDLVDQLKKSVEDFSALLKEGI